ALTAAGETTPAYEAKQLIAEHVRFGDSLSFPLEADPEPDLDAVIASDDVGRRVAVLVHLNCGAHSFELDRWPELAAFSRLRVMPGDDARPARRDSRGRLVVAFDGYSVAVLHD